MAIDRNAIVFPIVFNIPVHRLGNRVEHSVTHHTLESLLDAAMHGDDQRVNDSVSGLKRDLFKTVAEWETAVTEKSRETAMAITNGTHGTRQSASAKLAAAAAEIASQRAMIAELNAKLAAKK